MKPPVLVPSVEQPVVTAEFVYVLTTISRLFDDDPDVFPRGTRTDKAGVAHFSELTCLWLYAELVFALDGEMYVQLDISGAAARGQYMALRDTFAAIRGHCMQVGVPCFVDNERSPDDEPKAAPKIECTCDDHVHKPGFSPVSNLCCYTDCTCKAEG